MSEPTVYAIASGKGGVGKTTTAINLGAMLADRGHEVVVVDTDLGMANLADFLDFEIEEPTLHEVLAGDADFPEAVARAPGDIDVLPSGVDIEAFAKSDPANLQGVVGDLREEYDYVLLDTGAGVSYDTLVPLALADGVLLVATPDVASVRDTAKTGELAERVESEVTGAVLAQRSSDILNADDVEETLGTDVLAVVPADEAVPMGIDAGRPLAAFAPNAPAGQAYRELAAVLTGEADPDPELDLGDESDGEEREGDSTETAEVNADDFAAPDVAGNVREAAQGGDRSEGLLGGELANAAEEIRKQAAADREAADAEHAATAVEQDATEAETGDATEAAIDDAAEAGAEEPTEAADAGAADSASASEESGDDARSVEDLIDEHISDDRLGGGSLSEDADDPLAEMGEEFASEGEGTDGNEGTDEGKDTDGSEGTSEDEELTDESGFPDGETGDATAGETDDPDSRSEASDASADETAAFDGFEEAEPTENGRDDRASSAGEVPFGDESTSDAGDGDEIGQGANAERETELGRAAETDHDRESESGGILGRLGSLFK